MGSTPTNSTHPIIRAAVARAKSRRAHTAGARAAGRKDRACGRWCEAILRETFHRRKASSSWRRVTPHIAGAPRRGHHAAGATLADVAERVPIANARRRPVRLINRKTNRGGVCAVMRSFLRCSVSAASSSREPSIKKPYAAAPATWRSSPPIAAPHHASADLVAERCDAAICPELGEKWKCAICT